MWRDFSNKLAPALDFNYLLKLPMKIESTTPTPKQLKIVLRRYSFERKKQLNLIPRRTIPAEKATQMGWSAIGLLAVGANYGSYKFGQESDAKIAGIALDNKRKEIEIQIEELSQLKEPLISLIVINEPDSRFFEPILVNMKETPIKLRIPSVLEEFFLNLFS